MSTHDGLQYGRYHALCTAAAVPPLKPTEPRLEFLCTLTAELGPVVAIGDTPHGTRLIVPVTGGTVDGPHLKGKMLPGDGDWVLVRPDGVGELDVRSTIETHDGALLYASYRGYITRVMELIPR